METSLATRGTTALATAGTEESWGTEKASSEFIAIPYLLLMQKTSALVEKEKAKVGDLVNSTSETVLAASGKPLEVVPIFQFDKYWTIRKVDGNKFIKKLPWTASTRNLPYMGELDGVPVKNVLCADYAVLLAKDLKEGAGFPYIISFQSTSFSTAKQLETDLIMLRGENKPIAHFAYEVSSEKAANDKGQAYQIFKLKKGRKTTPAELALAKEWWKTVSNKPVKTDDVAADLADTEAKTMSEGDKF